MDASVILGALLRAGAAADLAADDQMTQAALGSVVVRWHVRFGHEDEEFLDVALNAPAQLALTASGSARKGWQMASSFRSKAS